MSTIHDLVGHAKGGLAGIQAAQRDWSPFLVHLTTWSAMKPIRSAIKDGKSAKDIAGLLEAADAVSAATARVIASSGTLKKSSPSKEDDVPECVCLTECTLPGLLGHCERFGRFGWVFTKRDLYAIGGRPCIYVGAEHYTEIAKLGRGPSASPVWRDLFAIANVLRPPGNGQVQDFTHEREWRVLSNIQLAEAAPVALIAPDAYVAEMRGLFPTVKQCIPLDTLHTWGV
ncbi:MAG: hypothetical protein L6Q99_12310 [Planctomycetes bacterium]|nr:hypothetical protein [Planctomycetota bacterium]